MLYETGYEGKYNYVVMQLLGQSLENLLQSYNKGFSVATVLALAEQTLARIESFHNHGLLHRDIKPDNFVIGRGISSGTVYIIDYGLAKQYKDPKTKRHIAYRNGKQLAGTARYASINTHLGTEQSRRDDLECLGYSLIYLAKGSLPWQGIKDASRKERYARICDKKITTKHIKLCEGLPEEFAAYMKLCSALDFDEKPDYLSMKRLFNSCFVRYEFHKDFRFDWQINPVNQVTVTKKDSNSNESDKGAVVNINPSNRSLNLIVPRELLCAGGVSGEIKQKYLKSGPIPQAQDCSPKALLANAIKNENQIYESRDSPKISNDWVELLPAKQTTSNVKNDIRILLKKIDASNVTQEESPLTKGEMSNTCMNDVKVISSENLKVCATEGGNMKDGKSDRSESCNFHSIEICERNQVNGNYSSI